MRGLIMIAHGSKKSLSNSEFLDLVNNIKRKDENFSQIGAAFLESATPNILSVVEQFIKKEISKIYFYPYFLNTGKHVGVDLPNIMRDLKNKYPLITFVLLTHFGKSEQISDLIVNDIALSLGEMSDLI